MRELHKAVPLLESNDNFRAGSATNIRQNRRKQTQDQSQTPLRHRKRFGRTQSDRKNFARNQKARLQVGRRVRPAAVYRRNGNCAQSSK